MIVTLDKEYLRELYTTGKTTDKQHRYQPQIAKKFVKVINLMKLETDVMKLTMYGSLHYEHLHGEKEGLSSVRINDQYRIEFTEDTIDGSIIANVCNIVELSNHYK